MPKNERKIFEEPFEELSKEVLESLEPEMPAPQVAAGKTYFEKTLWKGIKEVFRCTTCGTCRDDRDAMVMHVLLHEPPQDQNRVFDFLMKEN